MRRTRLHPLLALVIVFFGPLAAALLMYFGPWQLEELPLLDNPERVLLEAPERLPLEPLTRADGTRTSPDWGRYRWSLIYARMSPCEEPCLRELGRLSQVYYALGSDRDRVQRVLLFGSVPEAIESGPDLLVATLPDERGAELTALLGRRTVEDGRIFVADPAGDLVASYPPDADRELLLRDLERLLDVSGIG